MQPATRELLPGLNWRYRISSARCQALACLSRVVVLSAQVRFGCGGPHYVGPTLGGGEGWVGRPLDALIDVLGAQKQLFRVPGAAGGHRCRI